MQEAKLSAYMSEDAGGCGVSDWHSVDGSLRQALWPTAEGLQTLALSPTKILCSGRLYVLADSSAFDAHKENASQIVVQRLVQNFYEDDCEDPAAYPNSLAQCRERLETAVWTTHRQIVAQDEVLFCGRKEKHADGCAHRFTRQNLPKGRRCPLCGEQLVGLQAALSAAVFQAQELVLLGVGDIWALQLHQGAQAATILLEPLRQDHFIGMSEPPEEALRICQPTPAPGDRFILCSDSVAKLWQAKHGDIWLRAVAEAFSDKESATDQAQCLIHDPDVFQHSEQSLPPNSLADLTGLVIALPNVEEIEGLRLGSKMLTNMMSRKDVIINPDRVNEKLKDTLLHIRDDNLWRSFIRLQTGFGDLEKPLMSENQRPREVTQPTRESDSSSNQAQMATPSPFSDAAKAGEVRAALERGDFQTALRALENTPDSLDAPPEWAKLQAWAAFLEFAACIRAGDMEGALAADDRWPTALEQQLQQPSGNVLRRQLLIYREDSVKVVPLDVAVVQELVFADGERVAIGPAPQPGPEGAEKATVKPEPDSPPKPALPVVSSPERLVRQALQQGAQGQFAVAAQTLEQIADLEAWYLDAATLQEGLRAPDGMKERAFHLWKTDKYPELFRSSSPEDIALVDLRAAFKAADALMRQFGRACVLSPADENLASTQEQLDQQLPAHPLWKWFPAQILASQQALLPMLLRALVAASAGQWGEALRALNGHSADYGSYARTLEEARQRYVAAYLEAACATPALAIDPQSIPWLRAATPEGAALEAVWRVAEAVRDAQAGAPVAWLHAANWAYASPRLERLRQPYLERAWKALVRPYPALPEGEWQPLLAAAQQLATRSDAATKSRREALAYWLEFLSIERQHKNDKTSLSARHAIVERLWALPDMRGTIETYFWERGFEALRQPEDTRVYSDARLREDSQQLLQLPDAPVLHMSARVLAAVQAVRTRRGWEWKWPRAAELLIAALQEEQSLPLERRVDLERALWKHYVQPWSQSLSLERPLRWWQFRRRRSLRRLEACLLASQLQTAAVAQPRDALNQELAAQSLGEGSGSRSLRGWQYIVVAVSLVVVFVCALVMFRGVFGYSLVNLGAPPGTTESATHIAVSPPVIITINPQATISPVATPSEATPVEVATATSPPFIAGSPLRLERPVIVGLAPAPLYDLSFYELLKAWGYRSIEQGDEFGVMNELTRQISGGGIDDTGQAISYGWLPPESSLYFVLVGPVKWEETAVLDVPDFSALELFPAAGAEGLGPETLPNGTWVWGLGRAPELAQAVRACRVEAIKSGIEDILCAPPTPSAGNYLIFEPEFLIGVNANGWTGDPLLNTGKELAGWVFTDLGDYGLLRAMGSAERDAIRGRAAGGEYAIFDMIWRPGEWSQAQAVELHHLFVADSTGIYRHVPVE